jgi:hypothetical protein
MRYPPIASQRGASRVYEAIVDVVIIKTAAVFTR